MKVSGFFKQWVRALDTRPAPPAARHASDAHTRRAKTDGFEVTARPKVDLGKAPAASAAADTGFVKGLYRDLLGREPDAAGLASHVAGLRQGMSREEIQQVFLGSPEWRAKHAASKWVAPATATTPAATAQPTRVEQFKQLINADMRTAFGRDATDADYGYWLPKLQSPCDSGFVTSGQLTGVEYYHRRMLGWQAGGSDMATSGPYAGSSDANGPVPSATDVMGRLSDPTGPAAVGPTTPDRTPTTAQLRTLIAADIKTASGGTRQANDADYNYWLPMLQSPCDSGFVTGGQMTGVEYYHRRMLGWQAGGSDLALAGPYAGSPDANGPVPSATEVMGQA